MANGEDVQIAARVDKALYEKILKQRSEAKRLTGIEPSVAEVIRMLLEKGIEAKERSRAR